MYSLKSVKESASGIDSGVRTAGASNGIGCRGVVMESPSLDMLIRSKLSRFNMFVHAQSDSVGSYLLNRTGHKHDIIYPCVQHFLWLKEPTALPSGPRDLLLTLAAAIPSPSLSSISSALMYSLKSVKESASNIDSGVRTDGSSNVISL